MFTFNKRTIIQLGIVAAVVAAMAYLLHIFGLFDLLMDRQKLLAFIQDHRANASLLFIGLQIVQVVAAPVPGEVTGFVGGIFFGPFWGIVLSTIGLTAGSWLAFNLSRLVGRPLVEMIANPDTIKRYDYVMKHKGMFLAFLMFLIPGFPKDILCYLLGLGHMRQKDFLLVSTSGRLFGTTLLTAGGTFFRNAQYGAFFTIVAVSLGAIMAAMIYREKVERFFLKIRSAERLRAMTERRKLRKEQRKERRKLKKGKSSPS